MNPTDTIQRATEIGTQSLAGVTQYSWIAFHTDVTRMGALIIPIGVMTEISLPTVYALGLIARTELSTRELDLVSVLSRPLVEKPFKHLASLFEQAWSTLAPGAALNWLAEKHAYSALHFSVPKRSAVYLAAKPGLKTSIRMNVGVILDDQMMKLLRSRSEATHALQPLEASPHEELFQLKAAAAAA